MNFNKNPYIKLQGQNSSCYTGWDEVGSQLKQQLEGSGATKNVIVVECYQGVYQDEIVEALDLKISPQLILKSNDVFKKEEEIRSMVAPDLTNDRIFGKITNLDIKDYLDKNEVRDAQKRIKALKEGTILVVGTGASLVADPDILIYADMARWEIQQRMRNSSVSNIGVNNSADEASWQYKWGYFIDWRICDLLKKELYAKWDYYLDTNDAQLAKMVTGDVIQSVLKQAVTQPLMFTPLFDPGTWGGQWMKEEFDLDSDELNFAWCFNCVPEENSIKVQVDGEFIEIPAINLVFFQSRELLGEQVYSRFGAEFPIRFDFLDTMEGGNLSLQVHPDTEFIQDKFSMNYTQDESYYILDAKPGAKVYLGLKDSVEREELHEELKIADEGKNDFPAEKFVNTFEVQKHDHVHIPAGTIHCSGKDSMVLEISATPYIFTFKLWDWGRVGLDGKPRPINIERGINVIRFDRTTEWVEENLLHLVEPVSEGEGWCEEKTGLHELEFIETRRHWFTAKVEHHTRGTVHVLNLIEGDEVLIESPTDAFKPFPVHFAETFVIPAQVGRYTIKPHGHSKGKQCGTIKAFVRS